jgi:hypothetical protein
MCYRGNDKQFINVVVQHNEVPLLWYCGKVRPALRHSILHFGGGQKPRRKVLCL